MIPSTSVRDARAEDLPRARELAVETGLFSDQESHEVEQQLAQVVDGNESGSVVVAETDDAVVAAAYFAPEPFSDRCWNLYFLAVDPRHQGQGLGRLLVNEVETRLIALGSREARVLLIETSSTDAFVGTRAFYARRGYVQEATIRDYYGPEDSKVVFWKLLNA
ncbi:GNAT family N-acetyltransferase [Ornithinimicrobium sp. INDO-MA30-4]|uniref:GNAT family N-acetyltransferase n=1 Tax=Ornithinimicrobium sp. INDO-MA30-4 TaxID=2908651 RepID=UPI001F30A6D6|nr:GNAT family N-acetyltransferase [Ornithinimicrobium sp. INDO-MA30-4]UJH70363.1 GNAT family N-acetyltransferase [Ornithinimicrobium sp. INDO-MA30-4]